MSTMKTCMCERKHYRVEHRNHNHSFFESPKGLSHYSDYSGIRCMRCGWCFRSKAKWVFGCPDLSKQEWGKIDRNEFPETLNVGYSVSVQSF